MENVKNQGNTPFNIQFTNPLGSELRKKLISRQGKNRFESGMALLALGVMAACGGGSSSNTSPSPNPGGNSRIAHNPEINPDEMSADFSVISGSRAFAPAENTQNLHVAQATVEGAFINLGLADLNDSWSFSVEDRGDLTLSSGVVATNQYVLVYSGADSASQNPVRELLSTKAEALTGTITTITGTGGDDYIVGVDSTIVSLEKATAGATFTITNDFILEAEGIGKDRLIDINSFVTTRFNDNITGDADENTFIYMGGRDSFTAGAGNDTISFENSSGGSFIITSGAIGYNGSRVVLFSDVENLIVTEGADRIRTTTDAFSNIDGGKGNDTLQILGTANDFAAMIIQGGDGTDTLDLSNITGAVTVDLGGSSVTGIERVIGSAVGDTFTGTGGVETINAGGGNDIIWSKGGADNLDGGAGDDVFLVVGSNNILDSGSREFTYANADGNVARGYGAVDLSFTGLTGAQLTNSATSEGAAGSVYNGGAGDDAIIIYGNVDMTQISLPGIEQIITNSRLTLREEQLTGLNILGRSSDSNLQVQTTDGRVSLAEVELQGELRIAGVDRESNEIDTTFTIAAEDLESVANQMIVLGSGQKEVVLDVGMVGLENLDNLRRVVENSRDTLAKDGKVNLVGQTSSDGTGPAEEISIEVDTTTGKTKVSVGEMDLTFGDSGVGDAGRNADDAEILLGDERDNTISGGGGDDTITGGAGNDTLNGDAGNDSITGGSGNDTINGGDDDDTLTGGADNDRFVASKGTDTITDFATGDVVDFGQAGLGITDISQLTFTESGGNIEISFATGSGELEELHSLTLQNAGDIITAAATAGKDLATYFDDEDLVSILILRAVPALAGAISGGGDTIDVIDATASVTDNTVDFANNSATIDGKAFTLSMINGYFGGSGVDSITLSTAGDNIINGNGGDDEVILSTAGEYSISGSSISIGSRAHAISNIETITGTSGADTFNLSSIAGLTINGEGGADKFVLTSAVADATLGGGAGDDTLELTSGGAIDLSVADAISSMAVSGIEVLDLTSSVATVTLGSASNQFGTINFGTGANAIVGATNVNLTAGTADSIAIIGNVVSVTGSSGADTLRGTDGTQEFTGGGGNDTFIVSRGTDTITDFAAGDVIDFGQAGLGITDITDLDFSASGGNIEITFATGSGELEEIHSVTLQNAGAIITAAGATDLATYFDDEGLVSILNILTTADAVNGDISGSDAIDVVDISGAGVVYLVNFGSTTETLGSRSVIANAFSTADGITFSVNDEVEGIWTGSGDDHIRVSDTRSNIIDAGGGDDAVYVGAGTWTLAGSSLSNGTANHTISNVENFEGSSGAETFKLASVITSVALDGAGGDDTLEFTTAGTIDLSVANEINGMSASNFETLTLADGVNTLSITANSPNTFDTVNLGTGANVLNLVGLQGYTIDVSAGTYEVIGTTLNFTGNVASITSIGASGLFGDDTITAGDTDTTITTGSGDDTLNGGAGNDTLDGGAGADALNGGDGDDDLTGGAGDDTFTVSRGDDTITDFGDGTDIIDFGGAGLGISDVSQLTFNDDGTNVTITFMENSTEHTLTLQGTGATAAIGSGDVDAYFSTGAGASLLSIATLHDIGAFDNSETDANKNDILQRQDTDGTIWINFSADATWQTTGGDAVGANRFVIVTPFSAGSFTNINAYEGAFTGGADDKVDHVRIGGAAPALIIDGGGGDDSLYVGSGTWTYNGTTIDNGTVAHTISNFENLIGSSGAETFNLSSIGSMTINGEGGVDKFVLASAVAGATLNGGAGDDTLEFTTAGTYNVATANEVDSMSASNIETLTINGTAIAGVSTSFSAINGGAGTTDIFDIADGDNTTAYINLTDSSVTISGNNTAANSFRVGAKEIALSAFETYYGGDGTDILIIDSNTSAVTFDGKFGNDGVGITGAGTWTIAGTTDNFTLTTGSVEHTIISAGSLRTLDSNDNTYIVESGTLATGINDEDGDDVLQFNTAGSFDLSMSTVIQTRQVQGIETLKLSDGNDTITLSANSDTFETIDLGMGANAIVGATNVDLSAGTVGSVAIIGNVASVTGSSGADTFKGDTGDNNFAGGAGNDTFIASAGSDTIDDFADGDVIDFQNSGLGVFALSEIEFSESGTDLVLEFASSTLTLKDSTHVAALIAGVGSETVSGDFNDKAQAYFAGAESSNFALLNLVTETVVAGSPTFAGTANVFDVADLSSSTVDVAANFTGVDGTNANDIAVYARGFSFSGHIDDNIIAYTDAARSSIGTRAKADSIEGVTTGSGFDKFYATSDESFYFDGGTNDDFFTTTMTTVITQEEVLDPNDSAVTLTAQVSEMREVMVKAAEGVDELYIYQGVDVTTTMNAGTLSQTTTITEKGFSGLTANGGSVNFTYGEGATATTITTRNIEKFYIVDGDPTDKTSGGVDVVQDFNLTLTAVIDGLDLDVSGTGSDNDTLDLSAIVGMLDLTSGGNNPNSDSGIIRHVLGGVTSTMTVTGFDDIKLGNGNNEVMFDVGSGELGQVDSRYSHYTKTGNDDYDLDSYTIMIDGGEGDNTLKSAADSADNMLYKEQLEDRETFREHVNTIIFKDPVVASFLPTATVAEVDIRYNIDEETGGERYSGISFTNFQNFDGTGIVAGFTYISNNEPRIREFDERGALRTIDYKRETVDANGLIAQPDNEKLPYHGLPLADGRTTIYSPNGLTATLQSDGSFEVDLNNGVTHRLISYEYIDLGSNAVVDLSASRAGLTGFTGRSAKDAIDDVRAEETLDFTIRVGSSDVPRSVNFSGERDQEIFGFYNTGIDAIGTLITTAHDDSVLGSGEGNDTFVYKGGNDYFTGHEANGSTIETPANPADPDTFLFPHLLLQLQKQHHFGRDVLDLSQHAFTANNFTIGSGSYETTVGSTDFSVTATIVEADGAEIALQTIDVVKTTDNDDTISVDIDTLTNFTFVHQGGERIVTTHTTVTTTIDTVDIDAGGGNNDTVDITGTETGRGLNVYLGNSEASLGLGAQQSGLSSLGTAGIRNLLINNAETIKNSSSATNATLYYGGYNRIATAVDETNTDSTTLTVADDDFSSVTSAIFSRVGTTGSSYTVNLTYLNGTVGTHNLEGFTNFNGGGVAELDLVVGDGTLNGDVREFGDVQVINTTHNFKKFLFNVAGTAAADKISITGGTDNVNDNSYNFLHSAGNNEIDATTGSGYNSYSFAGESAGITATIAPIVTEMKGSQPFDRTEFVSDPDPTITIGSQNVKASGIERLIGSNQADEFSYLSGGANNDFTDFFLGGGDDSLTLNVERVKRNVIHEGELYNPFGTTDRLIDGGDGRDTLVYEHETVVLQSTRAEVTTNANGDLVATGGTERVETFLTGSNIDIDTFFQDDDTFVLTGASIGNRAEVITTVARDTNGNIIEDSVGNPTFETSTITVANEHTVRNIEVFETGDGHDKLTARLDVGRGIELNTGDGVDTVEITTLFSATNSARIDGGTSTREIESANYITKFGFVHFQTKAFTAEAPNSRGTNVVIFSADGKTFANAGTPEAQAIIDAAGTQTIAVEDIDTFILNNALGAPTTLTINKDAETVTIGAAPEGASNVEADGFYKGDFSIHNFEVIELGIGGGTFIDDESTAQIYIGQPISGSEIVDISGRSVALPAGEANKTYYSIANYTSGNFDQSHEESDDTFLNVTGVMGDDRDNEITVYNNGGATGFSEVKAMGGHDTIKILDSDIFYEAEAFQKVFHYRPNNGFLAEPTSTFTINQLATAYYKAFNFNLIDGGEGDDTLDLSAMTHNIVIDLQYTLKDIETFVGGSGNDIYTTENSPETWLEDNMKINGGAGNDIFQARYHVNDANIDAILDNIQNIEYIQILEGATLSQTNLTAIAQKGIGIRGGDQQDETLAITGGFDLSGLALSGQLEINGNGNDVTLNEATLSALQSEFAGTPRSLSFAAIENADISFAGTIDSLAVSDISLDNFGVLRELVRNDITKSGSFALTGNLMTPAGNAALAFDSGDVTVGSETIQTSDNSFTVPNANKTEDQFFYLSGNSDEFVTGGAGDDIVLFGAGDDRFYDYVGDTNSGNSATGTSTGTDVINGGAGDDTLDLRAADTGGAVTWTLSTSQDYYKLSSDGAYGDTYFKNFETLDLDNIFGSDDGLVISDFSAEGLIIDTGGEGATDKIIYDGVDNVTLTVVGEATQLETFRSSFNNSLLTRTLNGQDNLVLSNDDGFVQLGEIRNLKLSDADNILTVDFLTGDSVNIDGADGNDTLQLLGLGPAGPNGREVPEGLLLNPEISQIFNPAGRQVTIDGSEVIVRGTDATLQLGTRVVRLSDGKGGFENVTFTVLEPLAEPLDFTQNTFRNFESVVGSAGNDVFTVVLGHSISGTIDGGAGDDTIRFSGIGNIDLNDYTSFENAVGSDGVDIFIGTSADETFAGGTGNDTFHVSGGNDIIRDFRITGNGDDVINFGTGVAGNAVTGLTFEYEEVTQYPLDPNVASIQVGHIVISGYDGTATLTLESVGLLSAAGSLANTINALAGVDFDAKAKVYYGSGGTGNGAFTFTAPSPAQENSFALSTGYVIDFGTNDDRTIDFAHNDTLHFTNAGKSISVAEELWSAIQQGDLDITFANGDINVDYGDADLTFSKADGDDFANEFGADETVDSQSELADFIALLNVDIA